MSEAKKDTKLTDEALADWADEQKEIPNLSVLAPLAIGLLKTSKQRMCLLVRVFWLNPKITDKKRAELAGVTDRYYRMVQAEPGFKEAITEVSRRWLGSEVPKIANSYVTIARLGDRQAAERILEQCGVLDKPEKGGSSPIINVSVAIVEETRKKKLEEGLNRFGLTTNSSVSNG